MPDWFYRTVSRPILFRFSAPFARDFALGFMGRLAGLPFGPFLIDFLGHMRADPRLRRSLLDTTFPTAIGLGPWLDPHAAATEALSRFGIAFIEVGPVTYQGTTAARPVRRLENQEALWIDDEPGSISLAECNKRLSATALRVPVLVRVRQSSEEQKTADLIRELNSTASVMIVLTTDYNASIDRWSMHIDAILTAAGSRKILLCLTADQNLKTCSTMIDVALARGVAGFVVDGSIKDDAGGRLIGLPVREYALRQVRELRQRWNVPIIASGGIHEPEHALEFLSAGADLVQVDTGLIYTGPGLPKRINDCLLYEATRNAAQPDSPPRPSELTWFWTTLMGGGMFIGGLLALVIAATKVVLPYDEAFL